MKYIPATIYLGKFTCPHCGAISHMTWQSRDLEFAQYADDRRNLLRIANCSHCNKKSIWLRDNMLYPDRGTAPPPNPDMPKSVLKLYEEAASISSKSPRGAAALLRLAIQHLCKELNESGENINHDIGQLVNKGLPKTVQQSLDIVRVTGNNAVHPGQIDTDNEEVVGNLFMLLNVIIEYMISLPLKIETLYKDLPDGAKEQIEKRDNS